MKREAIILEFITPSLVAEVRNRIIEYLDPDKIILFGSSARNDVKEPNDIESMSSKRPFRTYVK